MAKSKAWEQYEKTELKLSSLPASQLSGILLLVAGWALRGALARSS